MDATARTLTEALLRRLRVYLGLLDYPEILHSPDTVIDMDVVTSELYVLGLLGLDGMVFLEIGHAPTLSSPEDDLNDDDAEDVLLPPGVPRRHAAEPHPAQPLLPAHDVCERIAEGFRTSGMGMRTNAQPNVTTGATGMPSSTTQRGTLGMLPSGSEGPGDVLLAPTEGNEGRVNEVQDNKGLPRPKKGIPKGSPGSGQKRAKTGTSSSVSPGSDLRSFLKK